MESASHGAGSDRFRDGEAGNGHAEDGVPPAQAFAAATALIGELKEYVGYYVGAKLDAVKLSVTNVVVYAVLGLIGAAVGVTVLAMAVVMLCSAVCNGLGNLFGYLLGPGWAWLGPLLFGLVILGGVAVGVIYGLKSFARTTRGKLVAKYEDRKRRERNNYGHDGDERARQQRYAERVERP